MTAALARVALAPVHATAAPRSEQVTQLALGEGVRVTAHDGEMVAVRTIMDGYGGWVHRGYLHLDEVHRVEEWLADAAWSEGATVEAAGMVIRVPHRGRLPREAADRVRMPGGGTGTLRDGTLRAYGEVIAANVGTAPAEWAWREFGGAPYAAISGEK